MFPSTCFDLKILAADGGGLIDPMAWLPIVAILALGYFMLVRPEQQKTAELRKMQDSLKKNDRVETVGGILATVVSVKKDQQVVVLRLDDKTGAEVRIRMRAIAAVLTKKEDASDNAES